MVRASFVSIWDCKEVFDTYHPPGREHNRKLDFMYRGALQPPQKRDGQAQNKNNRIGIQHTNGDELGIEIDAMGFDTRIPI